MPRHSSARFRCAGPALRLFLLSVFLTPSAFGQSMWKPFEPEWRMTARTAPLHRRRYRCRYRLAFGGLGVRCG